jgi:hypothetical protein
MTYREAVEINTRLHGGKPVDADERFALGEYLIDRVAAGNARSGSWSQCSSWRSTCSPS